MPVYFKQVISSFLTRSAYEKLAVSAVWHVFPGFVVLMLSRAQVAWVVVSLHYNNPNSIMLQGNKRTGKSD
jgi:thiosulfate reductase cytochrome b subunit